MNVKYNESTHNRPEGQRVVDAESVLTDTAHYIDEIKKEEAWQKQDRNAITVSKTPGMTVVIGGLHNGAELIHHLAGGVMSIHVLQGCLQFEVNGKTSDVKAGHILTIHKKAEYKAKATQETFYVLTMAKAEDK